MSNNLTDTFLSNFEQVCFTILLFNIIENGLIIELIRLISLIYYCTTSDFHEGFLRTSVNVHERSLGIFIHFHS